MTTDFSGKILRHYYDLMGWCIVMTKDYERARDIVQETYLRALLHPVDDPNKTWLFRIARNIFLNEERRNDIYAPIRHKLNSRPCGVEMKYEMKMDLKVVIDHIHTLEQGPTMLRYISGYEYHEIAEADGIPINTVKSRIRRCRIMLEKFGCKN